MSLERRRAHNWKAEGDSICPHCSNVFHQKPASIKAGKGKVWCSAACRKAERFVTLVCSTCQKEYRAFRCRAKRSRNCPSCTSPVINQFESKKGPNHICSVCHKFFYRKPSEVRLRYPNSGGGKYCSMRCKAIYMSSSGKNPTRNAVGGKRADLGIFFRSRWEANWARYLNWMKDRGEIKDWRYECETFEFAGIKRGSRFYTPDFKVFEKDGSVVFHEVKGWMDQKSATKLKRMAKYHPKVKIVLVEKRQYDDVRKGLCRIIPNWEHA